MIYFASGSAIRQGQPVAGESLVPRGAGYRTLGLRRDAELTAYQLGTVSCG